MTSEDGPGAGAELSQDGRMASVRDARGYAGPLVGGGGDGAVAKQEVKGRGTRLARGAKGVIPQFG